MMSRNIFAKVVIVAIAFLLPNCSFAQKQLVKSAVKGSKSLFKTEAKSLAKESAEAANKAILKDAFKTGSEEIGKNYVEKASAKQLLRREFRKSLLKEIEEKEVGSIMRYGTLTASKELKTIDKSVAKSVALKKSRNVDYAGRVSELKNNTKIKGLFAKDDKKGDLVQKSVNVEADLRDKKMSGSAYEKIAERQGRKYTPEQNLVLLKKYKAEIGLSDKKLERLCSEMNADNGLAQLIHDNPQFNIQRWLNTRNHVNQRAILKTPKGKMPQNARVYAGNVYYFNPHLNSGLNARLKRSNGIAKLKTEGALSYDDLVMLDKMYPQGVPFTKEGFPDFSYVAAKGKNGKPIKVDIGTLSGDSKADVGKAESIYLKQGYKSEAGYTWHHVENSTCLLRVPTKIHQLVDHSGGMSMSRL